MSEETLLNGILLHVKMMPEIKKERAAALLRGTVRKLDVLKPRSKEPCANSQALEHFYAEIKGIGVCVPITINSDNQIIDGDIRYRAAKQAGHKHIPVEVV